MNIRIEKISWLIVFVLFVFPLNGCVKENSPPIIVSVSVVPEIVEVGDIASVMITASDPENHLMNFSYEVVGGYISGIGSFVQWTAPPTQGVCLLTVTVSDGMGGSTIGNASLTVIKPPTMIEGTAAFPGGITGELGSSIVRLYDSWENWLATAPIYSTEVEGTGSSVSFTLENLEAGTYYLDVWSDNDNNSTRSIGDYIGWHGSGQLSDIKLQEIVVEQGQTTTLEVNMKKI